MSIEKKDKTKVKPPKKKPSKKKKIIIAVVMLGIAFGGSFGIYGILMLSLNTSTPIVVVISESMVPNINVGDLLFVKGEDGVNINVDDVIVYDARDLWFNPPNEPIVHRVINKHNISGVWHFETQGDANPTPDPALVPEDHVYGVVVGGIPYIGYVKIFLVDSGLLIPILIVVSALLVVSILYDLFKKDREEDRELNNNSDEETALKNNSQVED